MRTLIIALIAAAAPAAALAQSAAEQRMLDSQRSLLIQQQQQQRFDEVQRQVDNLDQRVRTNENLRTLEAQRAAIPTYTPSVIPPAAPATPAQIAEAERRRQASLEASEARLRALAAQQMR